MTRRRSAPRRRRGARAASPCRRSRATHEHDAVHAADTARVSRPPRRARARSARTGCRSHSRPIVVSTVCPGSTRRPWSSVISRSITESRTTSAGPPPTASRKSVSPEKQSSSLTTNATPSSECPGVGIASTRRPPVSSGAGHDRDPERGARAPPRARRDPRGRVCEGCASASRRSRSTSLEQRLERRAAVDEDRDAARLVADDERVREPPGVHRPLDDHRLTGYATDAGRARLTPCVARSAAILARPRPRRRRPRASAAVRVVEPFPLERYAGQRRDRTRRPRRRPERHPRERAQHAAHRRGARARCSAAPAVGPALIELGRGPPPDTLVVLPPPEGRSENDRYPIAVTPGPRGRPHLRLDADRRPRLAGRRRARRARGRRGRTTPSRRSSGSSTGSSATTGIRLPLTRPRGCTRLPRRALRPAVSRRG